MRALSGLSLVLFSCIAATALPGCSGNTTNGGRGGGGNGSGSTTSSGSMSGSAASGNNTSNGSGGQVIGVVPTPNPCDKAVVPEQCKLTPAGPACGDKAINQASEECDDGNSLPGDGCSGVCKVEPFF